MERIGIILYIPNKLIKWGREARNYYFLKASGPEGVKSYLFTDHELARAERRSQRNPEDQAY